MNKLKSLLTPISLLVIYIMSFFILVILANPQYEEIDQSLFLGILDLIILLMYLYNVKRYKWFLIIYSILYILFVYFIYSKEIMNALILQLMIMFFIPIVLIFDAIIQVFKKPKTTIKF